MTESRLDMQRRVGYNIKQWREFRRMTQKQLAIAAGISESMCIQAESGYRGMSVYNLSKVAEALHVSIDTLVYGQTKQAGIQTLVNMLEDVSPDDLEKIDEINYLILQFSKSHKSQV